MREKGHVVTLSREAGLFYISSLIVCLFYGVFTAWEAD